MPLQDAGSALLVQDAVVHVTAYGSSGDDETIKNTAGASTKPANQTVSPTKSKSGPPESSTDAKNVSSAADGNRTVEQTGDKVPNLAKPSQSMESPGEKSNNKTTTGTTPGSQSGKGTKIGMTNGTTKAGTTTAKAQPSAKTNKADGDMEEETKDKKGKMEGDKGNEKKPNLEKSSEKTPGNKTKEDNLEKEDTKNGDAGGRNPYDPSGVNNKAESSHFFAYLGSMAVVVAVLYIAYHNKRKILAFLLEGKKYKSTRRPKYAGYKKLEQHM
ncbi:trans-Golgi network integral membrane protein 1 [Etheostoma cragini]|uniref:trans-Golgi network integral membrane protein 1 n=1 Tax=Etheostoma cragini TaxID=417921 RepID=UPI00155DFF7D|nr:trans-Golgi network integral membrane protein 1 [Etheostoma cragini]